MTTINNQPPNTDPSVFEKINPSIKIKHWDGLKKLLDETDMTYLTYYYVKESRNAQLGALFLQNIAHKLEFLAGILLVDCEEIIPQDLSQCKKDPKAEDGYPRMELFVPPELKFNPYTKQINSYTSKVYTNREMSETNIYNFITQNIPSRAVKLTSDNIENFLNHLEFNKVILFTDKPKTPLLFRGLSTHYYDRLSFGEIDKDQTTLLKRFKVSHYPTLIVYQTHEDGIPLEEPIIEVYNKSINARDIAIFLEPYATPEKFYLKTRKTEDVEGLKYKVVFKNLTKEDVLGYMEKFKERRFVLYLSTNSDEISEDIKRFNKVTNGFFNFLHVKCKEEEEFCKKTFNVDKLPSLILINKDEHGDNEIKKRITRPVYLSMEYSEIVREIQNEFPSDLKEANPQNFASLTTESRMNKKVPFIYLYKSNDDVSLGLYLLGYENKYKKYVDFLAYQNPPAELVKHLNLKKLPQLLGFIIDGDKADRYIYY
jgi:protein disulfide-isomerase A6